MSVDRVIPIPGAMPSAAAHTAKGVLPLYAATLFLSAVLLFSIQPLIGRMALPLLGGSPAVWNTGMVFFQTALLAGYPYAHLSSRLFSPRRQAVIQITLLASAFVVLPVGLAAWTPPAEGAPVPWLVVLLAVSIGLPFFAVAANAPMVQRWFAYTGHHSASDPYFLYGASNVGSILALLAYPVVIEPLLPVAAQSAAWTWGYAALVAAIGACTLAAGHRAIPDAATIPTVGAAEAGEQVDWRRKLHWVALAAAPSSLLLALTAHISTVVASVPLLWILPLTLYLLTFVVTFARKPVLRHSWMVRLQPFLLIPMALFMWAQFAALEFLLLHLAAFFVTAMVCHGEPVRRRPAAEHLTEFYLWMSAGGMLGGAFAALVAPAVFDSVWEYPLVLALACLLRPKPSKTTRRDRRLDLLLPAAVAVVMLYWFDRFVTTPGAFNLEVGLFLLLLPTALALYAFSERPVRFALGIAMALFAAVPANEGNNAIAHERTFFGVHRVTTMADGAFRVLFHGRTIHGAQHTDPSRRSEPLTYYHRASPLGQMIDRLNASGRIRSAAVVGLGADSVACYRRPGQSWTFYEIDPTVVAIARDRGSFHYLSDCAPNASVVLGDARLSLRTAPSGAYDLLVLDAFSSDAIPLHLMTLEAFQLYFDKLAPGGVIMFHISNRHFKLTPVITRPATALGAIAWEQFSNVPPRERKIEFHYPSHWVAITRSIDGFEFLDSDKRWHRLKGEPGARPWTDDFADIVGVLRW